jgi:hypothetical protein
MGLNGAPPYLTTADPRTINTFESRKFQASLHILASEPEVRLRTDDRSNVHRVLSEFRADILAAHPLSGERSAYFFKHALACLVLPELCQLFDARFIYVVRPLADIERTRERRRWPAYIGAQGAKAVYGCMFDFFVSDRAPTLFVRYPELCAEPSAVIRDIVEFCRIHPIPSVDQLAHIVRTVAGSG